MLAILDPFSGVAGDMFLGALVDLGLPVAFLEQLPATLGLENVGVRILRTHRCGIGAVKVDFAIPPQTHGRHLTHILEIVERAPAPPEVKVKCAEAFRLIAAIEADVHGTAVEHVHLHEVGAVDAILDVVGTVWGVHQLGINDLRCGTIALGDGFVESAHGRMPVPAPATARLLEGLSVSAGPAGSGELTTPTGAALVRVLTHGGIPVSFTPRRVGYGAGTREFLDRPNVLRITLADALANGAGREILVMLTADIDDMSPEHLAIAAEDIRGQGALDVTLTTVVMKKGRPGTRIDVLSAPDAADRLELLILMKTSSIGVRRAEIFRHALPRENRVVTVMGHRVNVKLAWLPDGAFRVKPESDDVRQVALATGLSMERVTALAAAEAQRPVDSV